jgi:hypothetical protein
MFRLSSFGVRRRITQASSKPLGNSNSKLAGQHSLFGTSLEWTFGFFFGRLSHRPAYAFFEPFSPLLSVTSSSVSSSDYGKLNTIFISLFDAQKKELQREFFYFVE